MRGSLQLEQLGKKIERLNQISESINTLNVEHPVTDLADTLPWIYPNATRLIIEAPKPAIPHESC